MVGRNLTAGAPIDERFLPPRHPAYEEITKAGAPLMCASAVARMAEGLKGFELFAELGLRGYDDPIWNAFFSTAWTPTPCSTPSTARRTTPPTCCACTGSSPTTRTPRRAPCPLVAALPGSVRRAPAGTTHRPWRHHQVDGRRNIAGGIRRLAARLGRGGLPGVVASSRLGAAWERGC